MDMKVKLPWEGITLPDGYDLTQQGVIKQSDNRQSEEMISAPVWVHAQTEDANAGTFGMVLRWIDKRGNQKEQAFCAEIVFDQGKGLIQALARQGLFIAPGKERALVHYLTAFTGTESQWIHSVSQIGWINATNGKLSYLFPNASGAYGREGDQPIIFQPEQHSPTTHTMHAKGSLAQWQTHVAQPCSGNPYLVFCLCSALASILLKPARIENGGFHLYGRSSGGKTTALQVAASVFGCGADPADAPDQSYIQRWNTTGNALEALLAAHNDSLLVLDEIHTCDTRDFGRLIYNMAGGKGKAAMDKNRNLKQQRSWITLYLSSGELSAKQKTEEGNNKSYSGQQLRLVDIPTEESIIIETGDKSPADFAIQLKHACGDYYGTAGPAFTKKVIDRFESTHTLSHVIRRELAQCVDSLRIDNIEPEQARALNRFALVQCAGELAVELGILPFDTAEIGLSVSTVFKAWLKDRANLPERLRGVEAVQAFLLKNGVRFGCTIDHDRNSQIRDLAGYEHRNRSFYLFTCEGFREACAGIDPKVVAKELLNLGYLYTNEKGRLTSKHDIENRGRVRLYAVKKELLEYELVPAKETQSEKNSGASGATGQV